jgi:hypothetical protein
MLDSYRKKLIAIWCSGFLIPFVLILLQYFNGKYGDKFAEVLGWLTALTLSTILLMIGVMVSNPVRERDSNFLNAPDDALTEDEKEVRIALLAKDKHEKFVFQMAAGASIIYLLIINMTFFVEPLVTSKPQELMRDSKIWLAILDSFISLLIGYFFGKR